MSPFLASKDPDQMMMDRDNSEIYELRGVLLHKGPSAYHGHYEAQVYNLESVQSVCSQLPPPLTSPKDKEVVSIQRRSCHTIVFVLFFEAVDKCQQRAYNYGQ